MSHRLNSPRYLVGHWSLQGHAEDVSGYGNDGGWAGVEGYVDNQYGIQAGKFGGASDYISLGTVATLNSATKFTLAIWLNPDTVDTTQDEIWGNALPTSQRFWIVMRAAGELFIQILGNTNKAEISNYSTVISAGRWHHFVIVFDGTATGNLNRLKCYVDGEPVTLSYSGTIGSSLLSTSGNAFKIGYSVAATPFTGKLWGARLYNVPLTQDEAKALFLQTSPVRLVAQQPIVQAPDLTDASLRGAWLNNQVINTPNDASPEGNDMTVFGAPTMEKVGAKFNGSSDYLRRAVANWRSGDTRGTITAWIRLNSLGALQTIFGSGDEGSYGFWFDFRINVSNLLEIRYRDDVTQRGVEGNTVFVTGRWYHVAVITTGSAWALYVDGVVQSLTVTIGANTGAWIWHVPNRDNVTIAMSGRQAVTNYFDGEIRDVRYENAEKTAAFLLNEFRAGVPDPSLVLQVMGDGKDRSRFDRVLDLVGTAGVGRRIKLDGDSDYLIETVANWRGNDTQGTVMAWVKTTTSGAVRYIFGSGDESVGNVFFLLSVDGVSGDRLRFQWINGGTQTSIRGTATAFANDRWYHVALVSNGSAYTMYVNGAVEAFTVVSGSNDGAWLSGVANRDNITIGAYKINAVGGYWSGDIDAVKVYSEEKAAEWLRRYVLNTRMFF